MSIVINCDEKSNLIHYKDFNGFEEWYEYDKNNNIVSYKDSYPDKYRQ